VKFSLNNFLGRRLNLAKYTKDQFLDVAVRVCPKLKEEVAKMIGEEVWKAKEDIRDVISISKLISKTDTPEDIAKIMSTMKRYADAEEG
jgi:hypothetical protein